MTGAFERRETAPVPQERVAARPLARRKEGMERNERTFRLRPACPEAFETGKADDEHAAIYTFPVMGTRVSAKIVLFAQLCLPPHLPPPDRLSGGLPLRRLQRMQWVGRNRSTMSAVPSQSPKAVRPVPARGSHSASATSGRGCFVPIPNSWMELSAPQKRHRTYASEKLRRSAGDGSAPKRSLGGKHPACAYSGDSIGVGQSRSTGGRLRPRPNGRENGRTLRRSPVSRKHSGLVRAM